MIEQKTKTGKAGRLPLLDSIRGLTLISMILYHALWDAVFLYGAEIGWYRSTAGFLWQQSICWSFILLSGFCTALGSHPFRRGWTVFGCGLLVTAVTLFVLPNEPIIFGVLTFLGSAMLLSGFAKPLLDRVSPAAAVPCAAASFFLFLFLYPTGRGYAGIDGIFSVFFPRQLYAGYGAAFLGFQPPDFVSSDYFPLLPWLFLFMTGLFAGKAMKSQFFRAFWNRGFSPLSFLGRHSLAVYLVHQPLLYLAFRLAA